jgi:signal transduction histidine kinase
MGRLMPGTGHDALWWPVLLLLLLVLVPSAGIVWMMRAAMDNERLAVRQRLVEAYQSQLEIARQRIDEFWHLRLNQLDAISEGNSPTDIFSAAVRSGVADSAIVLDERGSVIYPNTEAELDAIEIDDAAWLRAQRLEFNERDPRAAARAYEEVGQRATTPAVKSRALRAAARNWLRAGQHGLAIDALRQLTRFDAAPDLLGRSLAAHAKLRLLQLLDATAGERRKIAESLAKQLQTYDSFALPASQRRFLMHELVSLQPDVKLTMLAAEDLAAEFATQLRELPRAGELQQTRVPNLWQMRTESGRVIGLYESQSIEFEMADALATQPLPNGVTISVEAPSSIKRKSDDLVALNLASPMTGWRLSLRFSGRHSFDSVAREQTAFFLWTAILVVLSTIILALLAAGFLRRQLRLARLKNDLVATVSHELKTPLASIRLLVDTLLDAGERSDWKLDNNTSRQYLELISQENARLSRLIENFLTFSRMDRGKHRFKFEPVDAAKIVERAVAAVAERFDGVAAQLRVDVNRPLTIVADADALVTVVVNLLDNAWKYSNEVKKVTVTARQEAGQVVIDVQDNGIGLSPRSMRRVFDRFYQVDQHLSRSHGGCGLGLSIVKYCVKAHGGNLTVESKVNYGTKFIVSLAAASGAGEVRPNSVNGLPADAEPRQQASAL